MAMNVGRDDDDDVIAAINTTPLVDVMLVLLIIFLITIPVAINTVPVQLPVANNVPNVTKPINITLAVDVDGNVYWGPEQLPDNETLLAKLKEVAAQEPQPEIQVRGDKDTRFEFIGKVLVDAQRAGIVHVGFITQPERPQ